MRAPYLKQDRQFAAYPTPDRWDDWVEYESLAWPRKVEKRYWIIPSLCFNCESACGILAYVDQETLKVRKIEGNPMHPGSRGRLCAKGSVTPNQLEDPDRILYPLKREGRRGEGRWRRVAWDEALDDIAARMRQAIQAGRPNDIMYHVGRPGEDGHVQRVLQAWGSDGHNSHTNICSSSARLGYHLWTGSDRPSPDHAMARVILLLSSHLETGHYFNPHAQRIIEGQMAGAKVITIDPRLSNTAAKGDYWLPARPGTEGALLLAMANVLLRENLYDAEFVRRWVNWPEYLRHEQPGTPVTFDRFIATLKELYGRYTPEFAAEECGVPAETIVECARLIGGAGSRFATHNWRSAATGHLWGWQITRCLELLVVLVGAVATEGGTGLHKWTKFVPRHPHPAPPPKEWNELLWPREYPLACYEVSQNFPHMLKEGRGRVEVYFTRVFNPVWTYPDGFTWMEVLSDESKIGLHVAMTPTWSETAWFADYILPMGLGTERHDNQSQETHAARWIGFRQPVLRVAREKAGRSVARTSEANPGEVWEHNEFWIQLSWRVDPDGSLGIRNYFESPYRPGDQMTMDDYYRWMFEHVPGLPEAAGREGLTPLAYMRKYGVFEVEKNVYRLYERPVAAADLQGSQVDPVTGVITQGGKAIGLMVDGKACVGFETPSRKLEFWSPTLKDWHWPEHAIPAYAPGHVYWRDLKPDQNEFDLMPNFRLPTMIHTRGAVKWLYELSHSNPVWINPEDARRLEVATGDLVKVETAIGYFIDRAFVTEGIRPGVVGCSHHLGRWRLQKEAGGARVASAWVDLQRLGNGQYKLRVIEGIRPFKSDDPDTERVWWREAGVNQNLTFPVQTDPVSGQHCWHQKVRVTKAGPDDRYGDIFVDTERSHQRYKEWLERCRPAPGPGNLRRPLWLDRPLKPAPEVYQFSHP
jgi:anaerobic selenocysteine-containing dehydrogenase